MNIQDIIIQARQGLSDNKLSKELGVSRQAVKWWREGTIPKDEILDKLAEMSGIPVEKVYFAAYAEKLHNPKVAAAFRHLAA
jgi:transcriptional regulator with XRE-family HTH domain